MRVPIAYLLAVFLLSACGANESVLRSGKDSPTPASDQPVKSTFARDLDEFRMADFGFVYVVRRRDGGLMDAEDRQAIKVNTIEANRRVSTDDGKAFLIGANNLLRPENMTALQSRFAVEDHSPPPQPANTSSNSNPGK
jgi:hypothetical protein